MANFMCDNLISHRHTGAVLLLLVIFPVCTGSVTYRATDVCSAAQTCWSAEAMERGYSNQRPEFVLFGDSLTQKASDPEGGWAAALAHNYQRKVVSHPRQLLLSQTRLGLIQDQSSRSSPQVALQVDVINRGYSGYNTRWASHLLHSIFPPGQHKIQLVTLFWGANDAALPDRHRCNIADMQTMDQTNPIAFVTVLKLWHSTCTW